MLNRLLRSITDKNNVTGEIATGVDERLDMAMIVPAESIRGLPNAKIYTSYTKFANWMSAEFGFVPVIGDEKVTFVHRDTLFQDTEIKDLQDSTSDLEYNVNAGLVYSGVKVGYDKQDYDSVNGRDEFRFTNEYTTGITLTDNVLELVSPYRADVYGMEFLAEKRGEDTTDSDSDNDIFFVGASLDGEKYKVIGFENHGGQTTNVKSPFGKVLSGNGNEFESSTEGYMEKSVIATYLHGPLLSKNPKVSDYVISYCMSRKFGEKYIPAPINDKLEEDCRKQLFERLGV